VCGIAVMYILLVKNGQPELQVLTYRTVLLSFLLQPSHSERSVGNLRPKTVITQGSFSAADVSSSTLLFFREKNFYNVLSTLNFHKPLQKPSPPISLTYEMLCAPCELSWSLYFDFWIPCTKYNYSDNLKMALTESSKVMLDLLFISYWLLRCVLN